ncbi:MAG: efflux RND transporter periplasmic adaptor subunit [Candidatus Pacebacteria bacterium]|jgi:HlyD family secretion protein|nr:efflux RND transporter periplasmic adaptor subunit [Candidatus Paceibacterota bacterium]
MQLSKKHFIIGGVVGAIIIGGFIITNKKETTLPGTTVVKYGNIVQEVSVTGRVKSTTTVDLGFEKSGRVAGVYTAVGKHIEAGKILAEIESSSAEGSLREAEARLAELKRGSRPEELAVKKAELAKYTQDLTSAYEGATDVLSDAFTKADDALHGKTSAILSGGKTSSYKYTFSICDSQLTTDGEWLRYTSEVDLDIWRKENLAFPTTPSHEDLIQALDRTKAHLEKILAFLESAGHALSLDCTVSNTTLDAHRTNINTARTNVNTALSSVNTKAQSIAALVLTVQKVKNELSLLEAGTASEVIAAQEARVLSARGELAKYRIVAPISGVVTKAGIEVGEGSTMGTTVFSIISDTSFKAESHVPEADIAKIKLGDMAKVTLDAYGPDVVFEARVTEIEPAETIVDNVPTYKTTFHFTQNDPRIKSGMTANIDVRTASRENALYVPERAIINKNGEKFIRVVASDNTTTDVVVTTGLKGSDGSIEVLTGVKQGDTIIMAPKD